MNEIRQIRRIGLMGLVGLILAGATLVGCKLIGSDPAPPSAFEQRYFDIQTNLVARVQEEKRTNWVTQTNLVVLTVTRTNEVNQVVPVQVTNYTTVPVPVTFTVTNVVQKEEYVYRPNTNAAAVSQTAGQIGALSGIPGVGSLVGMAAGLLWGLWGTLRSSKANKTASALAQIIQVGREVLTQTPQGAEAAEAWKTWMIQHQAEQGVIESVMRLLPTAVDGDAARITAAKLLELMQETKGTV